MVGIKLFVEGGGDAKSLRTACREGFAEFLQKAGLAGHMPRIVACGSRQSAYKDFCTAIGNHEAALLLVDSEDKINNQSSFQPWLHLANRLGDQWQKPQNAEDAHCHLMVQCMESWFLADREMLAKFFGQGFNANALPAQENNIETVAKEQVYQSLANASKNCKTKAAYSKSEHSFKLLREIDPDNVTKASAWAHRFIAELKQECGVNA